MRKLFFLLLLFPSVYYSQEVINLERAIQLAVSNNFNIKIASNNIERAEKQHHIGNAGMLPTVSSSATLFNRGVGIVEQTRQGFTDVINPATTRNFRYGLGVDQTIFDGLAMFRTYNRLAELVDFQSLKKQEEVENVISQVITSYYDLLLAQNAVKTQEETITLSAERVALASKRVKLGSATRLDLLNAQVDLANDSTSLLETQRSLRQSKAYLDYLLSLPTGQTQKSYADTVILNKGFLSSLEPRHTTANVLLKQSQKNEVITELDYKLYKAAKLPKLYLSLDFNHSKSQSDYGFANKSVSDQFSFGITASYTIFQGFQRDIQMQTAKIDQLNQQLQSDEIASRIQRDFVTSQENFRIRVQQFELEEKNLSLYQENYERSKQAYEYGKITPSQLREAQLNLFQSKRRLYESMVSAKREEVELLRLTGRLLSFSQ